MKYKTEISRNENIQELEDYQAVLSEAQQDIYTSILNHINNTNLTRTDVKSKIMMWLFSTNNQRQHIKNNIVKYINQYFKEKHPYFYQFICNYPVVKSDKNTNPKFHFSNKSKLISKLSLDCFQLESNRFLTEQHVYINNSLYNKNVINLHDGIFKKGILYKFNIYNIFKSFLNIYKHILKVIYYYNDNNIITYNNNNIDYICGVNSS